MMGIMEKGLEVGYYISEVLMGDGINQFPEVLFGYIGHSFFSKSFNGDGPIGVGFGDKVAGGEAEFVYDGGGKGS